MRHQDKEIKHQDKEKRHHERERDTKTRKRDFETARNGREEDIGQRTEPKPEHEEEEGSIVAVPDTLRRRCKARGRGEERETGRLGGEGGEKKKGWMGWRRVRACVCDLSVNLPLAQPWPS